MHWTAISGNYRQETFFAELCMLKSCNVKNGKRFEHKPQRIFWGVSFLTFCNDDVDDDLLNLNLLICPHTHGSSTPLPSLMLITARASRPPAHLCTIMCTNMYQATNTPPNFTACTEHSCVSLLKPGLFMQTLLWHALETKGVSVHLHFQSRVLQIRVRRGACAQWQSQCPLELEGCGLEICQFGILLAPPRRPFPHTPPQTWLHQTKETKLC